MRNSVIFLVLLLNSAIYLTAQQPTPQPTPNIAQEAQRTIRRNEETTRRFEILRNGGANQRRINPSALAAAMQTVNNIYRKPTRDEFILLALYKDDLKKYERFLSQPQTGITKLMMDRGCAESPNVLNVSEECLKYSMPGAGASFSFRTKNYRVRRLSDLTYDGSIFHSSGILSHSIMVELGDVPLETVSVQSKGLKFLTDFQPVTDFELAKKKDTEIRNGVENDGFFYSHQLEAKKDSTYVLRVVAYRGKLYRAINGFVYEELDFDERRDVTVAFRVVRREPESIVILWKILLDQKSPSIKKPSREQLEIEENKYTAKAADGN